MNKWLPKPIEGYDVWEKLAGKKFRSTVLTSGASTEEIDCIRDYVSKLLWAQSKNSFIAKFTGPPRIFFLSSIFPDAKFVYIMRDPRAVVSSLLRVNFWTKDKFLKGYWQGLFSESEIDFILQSDHPEVASTALHWKKITQLTDSEINQNSTDSVSIVKYEGLMDNPMETICGLTRKLDLAYTKEIDEYLENRPFSNMNYKYHEHLTNQEIALIESVCEVEMKKFYAD